MFTSKNKFEIKKVFFLLLILNAISFAQVSNYIASVDVINAKEGQPFAIRAELYQSSTVSRLLFMYKVFGSSEFIEQEMEQFGTKATAMIPAEDIAPPFVEYYLVVETVDGARESYPIGTPDEASPFQVSIQPVDEKDREILILSPTSDEKVGLDDLIISISLLRAPNNVDKSATRLFIDDEDVTSMALFADDLILFYPSNFSGSIKAGRHVLRVDAYDNEGNLYHTVSSGFSALSGRSSGMYTSAFNYSFDLSGESRNERFNEEETWYNNVDAVFRGDIEDWQFKGRAYITSEEKNYRQPNNRYTAEISNSWMYVKAGDNFPRYPDLIINGKRLRGFSGGLRLGYINLEASYGQVTRSIEGQYLHGYSKNEAPLGSNIIAVDSVVYGNPYAEVNLGTYERNLFTARLSSEGKNYGVGFSYLHGKDDQGSIKFGTSPQENAVAGFDIRLGFDQNRVELTGQAGFSIYNNDISTGTLTDEEIDKIFGEGSIYDSDPEDIKKLRDVLGNFITINQYVGPLNPEELSSFAYETALKLNYFNNNLKAKYIYRGNDYLSFGQSFLRKDVAGININDRIRMLDNKLFFMIGYESLKDNLQNTKFTTTKYNTINTSVSIYPRTDAPNITLGFTRYFNENDLPSDSLYSVKDFTNNFIASVNYRFKAGIQHDARLSISTSNREDESYSNNDANILSTFLSFNSTWSQYTISIFNVVYSSSEISGEPYKYATVTVGSKFRFIENKLQVTASISPSFGDFQRIAFDLYGDYQFTEIFSLGFQARYYNTKTILDTYTGNSILGITARVLM